MSGVLWVRAERGREVGESSGWRRRGGFIVRKVRRGYILEFRVSGKGCDLYSRECGAINNRDERVWVNVSLVAVKAFA